MKKQFVIFLVLVNYVLFSQYTVERVYGYFSDYNSHTILLYQNNTFHYYVSNENATTSIKVGNWLIANDSLQLTFKDSVAATDVIKDISYSFHGPFTQHKDEKRIYVFDDIHEPAEYFHFVQYKDSLHYEDYSSSAYGQFFSIKTDTSQYIYKFVNDSGFVNFVTNKMSKINFLPISLITQKPYKLNLAELPPITIINLNISKEYFTLNNFFVTSNTKGTKKYKLYKEYMEDKVENEIFKFNRYK